MRKKTMIPNEKKENESAKSAFERLVGGFGEPESMLLEPIQSNFDARIEDEHTETRTRTGIGAPSGMTPEKFQSEFVSTNAAEGDE